MKFRRIKNCDDACIERNSSLQGASGGYIKHGLVLLIFISLSSVIFFAQYNKWIYGSVIAADTGFFLEMTENIANGNGPVSSIHAGMNNFFRNKIQLQTADQLCAMEFVREPEEFRRVFDSHKYYVAYLLAPLAKIFDVRAVLFMGQVAGFFLILYLVYRLLREERVPLLPAWLFVGLIFVHPAWSMAVSGQLYAERYFIPFAMLFLYFLRKKENNIVLLYIAAVLTALVSERASMILGMYVSGYVILLWGEVRSEQRKHLLVIALALIAFSLYELSTLSNLHYQGSTFLPGSFDELMSRLQNVAFFDKLQTFLLFSLVFLGIFAIFAWRLLLLALVMLLPNIVGNIGGAEKTGYLTHYHTLYFPFLVFAATIGYAKLVNRVTKAQTYFFVAPLTAAIMLFSMATSPYDRSVTIANMTNENALLKHMELLPELSGSDSSLNLYLHKFEEIRNAIPEGSIVTSSEKIQALLHNHVTNYYYPMGLDIADYAVLYVSMRDGREEYSGAVTYEGKTELEKINACLHERMLRAGYDFENKVVINSYAIVRRVKSTGD